MCRLLLIKSRHPVSITPLLTAFARACHASVEYQGDGWGIHWRLGTARHLHRSLAPIWEDELGGFGEANLVLAHARSAFRDASPTLEHTMPFTDGDTCFAFNGELHGVRVRAEGSNGAHKIFTLTRRLLRSDPEQGFQRAVRAIRERTERLRALNILMTDGDRVMCSSVFSQEEQEYFTLHTLQSDGFLAVCSEPLPEISGWRPMANNTVEVLQ